MDTSEESKRLALEKVLHDGSGDPTYLPLSLLEAITNNFSDSEKIGMGGFGAVYKGKLRDGMVVAVKKLHEQLEVLEENFRKEVYFMKQIKRRNIVLFLGYCSETRYVLVPHGGRDEWASVRQRLLCFEYLHNGNLANYLTGK